MNEYCGLKKTMVFSLIALFLMVLFTEYAFSRAGSRSSSRSRSYSSRSSSSYRSSGYSSRPSSSYYGSSSYGRRYYTNSYYGRGSGGSVSIMIILATIVIIIIVAVIWSMFSSAKSSYSSGGYSNQGNYGSGYSSFSGSSSPSSNYGYMAGGGGRRISDPDAERRIREVFMQIQQAWMERNPYISQRHMSERLFAEHSAEIQEMIDDGVRNVLQNIRIIDIKIIEKAGGPSSAGGSLEPGGAFGGGPVLGRMAAYITASMIDYEVDENTGQVVGGDRDTQEEFTELWKFVSGPTGWVADEIDS